MVALTAMFGGCDCNASLGDACVTAADCEAGQTCVDSRCVARTDTGPDGDDAGEDPVDANLPDLGTPDVPPELDTGPTDAFCGGGTVEIDYRAPNVMVILDRSCSMRRRVDMPGEFGTGPDDPRTRWNQAASAVLSLVRADETRIFWGLMAFPDSREGCGDDVSAEVLPMPRAGDAIETELARNRIQPFGLCGTPEQPAETPTMFALRAARDMPELLTEERESFAILIADGGASCGHTRDDLERVAGAMLDRGIPTAVIGFTTGGTVETLEGVATAGGLPAPGGPPSSYIADDRASLDTVLGEILERVVSCTLPLASSPPDEEIFVYVDGTELAEGMDDGWTYDMDANAITLHGTTCTDLQRGDITRVEVTFGCPPSACEPRAEVCNGLDEDCDDRVDEDCLL
jgi:hypothetical protein